MTGKGSVPRPLSVDAGTFAEHYARTFSRVIDDPSGYDDREKECPPLDIPPEAMETTRAAFRNLREGMQQHLVDRTNAILERRGYPQIQSLTTQENVSK